MPLSYHTEASLKDITVTFSFTPKSCLAHFKWWYCEPIPLPGVFAQNVQPVTYKAIWNLIAYTQNWVSIFLEKTLTITLMWVYCAAKWVSIQFVHHNLGKKLIYRKMWKPAKWTSRAISTTHSFIILNNSSTKRIKHMPQVKLSWVFTLHTWKLKYLDHARVMPYGRSCNRSKRAI